MDRIANYTTGIEFERFAIDAMIFDAVRWNLQEIGEASFHLPESVRGGLPEVPWEDLRRLRNRAVHQYFLLDPEPVWKTIHEDLPKACARITAFLAVHEEKEP
jgi:uncharacterized protein with HEPN domain